MMYCIASYSILLAAALSASDASEADFDTTDWTWQRSIELSDAPPGFVRVALPPEVFDESQSSLNDLRILDETNTLVPFISHRLPKAVSDTVSWRAAPLINVMFQPGEYARVTLDFGERFIKNRVRITLSERNFRRKILLEGSEDGQTWAIVAENQWLFDIHTPEAQFKVDTVDFPLNNQPFLRLTVYNMPDDPRQIAVNAVEAAQAAVQTDEGSETVPVTLVSTSTDKDKKLTVYDFDLGFRNLPLIEISFDVADAYFYRGYTLVGRNSETEKIERKTETGWDVTEVETPWMPVSHCVLYRIEEADKRSECTKIALSGAGYRHLQLRVHDGDDKPLTIRGASAKRSTVHLVFETQQGCRYSLIGGNPKAGPAQFDLARTMHNLEDRPTPTVALGPQAKIAHEPVLAPWTERHSVLILCVLVAAALVVAGLVISGLRRVKETPQ